MSWKSISHIASEAGVSTRTVKKRCEGLTQQKGPKNSIVLDTRDAYRAIFEKRDSEDLDLQQERARLAKEQADKYELENELRRKKQLDADEVQEMMTECAAAVRAKLLPLPVKLARVAQAAESLQEIEQAVKTEIYAALNELVAIDDGQIKKLISMK